MSKQPHFSILAQSFAGGPRPRNAALILSGLWLVIFFCALFTPPLLDDADATHAQAAQAMVRTGDLVTLKVDGVRYLEKAPLPYWLVAASFRIFGFNTFAAHLPQAVAVLLLMLLGHRWANQAFGARTAYYTSIFVLTSAGIFLFTRILIPEVLLSLFLCASLFALLKALGPVSVPNGSVGTLSGERREQPATAWYAGPGFYSYLMWSTLALAVLTKGLVALVFFFFTAMAYLLLTDDWRKWRRLRPTSGGLVFLLIAAPWHILAGLRNTGGMNGHGFFWFYFVNEHFLRFLGRRYPMDYNKLPSYLFWSLHLVWLFPWTLFLPLGVAALARRFQHQTRTLTGHLSKTVLMPSRNGQALWIALGLFFLGVAGYLLFTGRIDTFLVVLVSALAVIVPLRRSAAGLTASPFHRIDPQQKSILLLTLFAAAVLCFFSISTNQEYYTFPAYLPILLLIAATVTRAEQTYTFDRSARHWVTFAHITFALLGAAIAIALAYGLWASRNRPFVADIGDLLAHRGVGDYTLSMSHLFDLTSSSFAALRFPAILAALAFALGPGLAWMLRMQRRHLAATTAIAFTMCFFLMAAHSAFARFGTMLSSKSFADTIRRMERNGQIEPTSRIMLYGDQSYGSSIPFYLGRQVTLVEGRSTSLLFGSTFPDAPPLFLSGPQLLTEWGTGERKVLFVPLERRDVVDRLLKNRPQVLLEERSGKALITDRPLGVR